MSTLEDTASHKIPTSQLRTTSKARFSHINIDIVGPFPLCEGQRYCLTMIDRYTRWPEAAPMPDMSVESVAKALLSHWIARFGVPERITSDQGRQFDSAVFAELITTIGATHLRTTPYHPQSNGIIERWHRSFKVAILCHDPTRWVQHLPTILLGLRVAYKPDIKACPALLVYGSTLRIPGEFLQGAEQTKATEETVSQFRSAMQKLRPTQTSHHTTIKVFVPPALKTATHVFVRNDSIRPSLTRPYDGPYPIIKRSSKYFNIQMRGRNTNISIDRLKPAFLTHADLEDTTVIPSTVERPQQQLESPQQQLESPHLSPEDKLPQHQPLPIPKQKSQQQQNSAMKPTRSGRHVTIPLRYR
ncbi:PREDICTED: uncharacterized protein LOC108368956 [Rhagoletis zephyria]|uniref:uncharacterized protein LOC108368956 n=1 Tax=Rhagoletis zephyria TaxID=28612 RepID=UPI00081157D1|nr:PREDICTED: uncharacterized protein LOC108368956 [Rhagoletis zephyria]